MQGTSPEMRHGLDASALDCAEFEPIGGARGHDTPCLVAEDLHMHGKLLFMNTTCAAVCNVIRDDAAETEMRGR